MTFRLLGYFGAAALLAVIFAIPASADASSPIGKWRTFDPDTGAPKTVVEITEAGGSLTGTIVELLDNGETTCPKCDGARKNQPLVGMVILWDLTPKGSGWSGGTILRPANGKTANASIELADGGSKLDVTGSRGIGSRTQTWERVE
ncbi:MAG: DUF2147 domain-containing protein [Parvibaculum sp.]|jgi:uncharacterized protein (DUF2147 family)|nr:DUF2147 domain-containing protein [Parvibaculum sp.]